MKGKLLRIEIREFTDQQPNGDRDVRLHPSARFEVELVDLEHEPPVRLADFRQFNVFECIIRGTRDQYFAQAQQYAKPIAERLGIPLVHVQMAEVVRQPEYKAGTETVLG